jgi:hypothetical protein
MPIPIDGMELDKKIAWTPAQFSLFFTRVKNDFLSPLVKTKRQANFKDFKRFGAFKGLVEQKNVVLNSFVCKLGFFGTRAKKNPIYTRTRQINYYFLTAHTKTIQLRVYFITETSISILLSFFMICEYLTLSGYPL